MTREEAINKVRQMSLPKETMDILEALAPELTMSEDEMMIYELQGFLSSFGSDYFGNGEWQKFDDWLEKQNEQKPAEFTHHETNESLKDAVTHQMEDDGDIDDFVRKGIDDVVLKYAKLGAKWQKEQKPKQVPKWLYRLEFKDNSCGLWYNGQGEWCFENGIGSLDDSCKTKNLPMDYDERYKQDGRNWFSSCSKKEDLLHWYSKEDAKTLLNKGFVFTRYLATEYHEYDQQTVFIKETALYREEINFLELMKEQKPANLNLTTWHRDVVYCAMCDKNLDEGLRCNLEVVYKTIKELVDRTPVVEEQKPAEWSEEDEGELQNAIDALEFLGKKGVYKSESGYDAALQAASWLKDFPERFAIQPKEEWSEEDEKMLWIIQLALTKHPITDK